MLLSKTLRTHQNAAFYLAQGKYAAMNTASYIVFPRFPSIRLPLHNFVCGQMQRRSLSMVASTRIEAEFPVCVTFTATRRAQLWGISFGWAHWRNHDGGGERIRGWPSLLLLHAVPLVIAVPLKSWTVDNLSYDIQWMCNRNVVERHLTSCGATAWMTLTSVNSKGQ